MTRENPDQPLNGSRNGPLNGPLSGPLRGLWLALLLALLAMRALLPAGYMPAAQADGRVTFILCGISGGTPIDVDFGHGKQLPPGSDEPCAFAGLGLPLLGTAPMVLAVPLRLLLPLQQLATVAPKTGPPADLRLPPSQGPPARS